MNRSLARLRERRVLSMIIAALVVGAVAPPPALASTPQLDSAPRHSGSTAGGVIAFSGFPDDTESGDAQVFVINADGTGERQLTHVPGGSGAGSPDISPDGTMIAYVSNEGGSFAIWAMAADGSHQRKLLGRDGFDFFRPSWSPNGKRLVATRCDNRLPVTTECDLVGLGSDGTRVRTLLSNERNNVDPTWSPDGSKIAFTSDRLGYFSTINVMPASGGTPTRITAGSFEGFWPSWAPDSRHLIASDNCCQLSPDAFRMLVDGSQLTQLTHAGGRNAAYAGYSPNGRRIVFVSDVGRPPDTGTDLYTMRADGTDVRLLVSDHPGVALSDWGISPTTTGRAGR